MFLKLCLQISLNPTFCFSAVGDKLSSIHFDNVPILIHFFRQHLTPKTGIQSSSRADGLLQIKKMESMNRL